MEFRQGTTDDLNNICSLIVAAIQTMEEQGIHQWDELYPTREDFVNDITNGTLYTVTEKSRLIAIYTISTVCDPEYLNAEWECNGEMACIIHRLCVSPDVQNRGFGKIVFNHIENQLRNIGYQSVRLDVFSENLFKDLGTDTTTAIRMFLTQALAVNGFPFEIKRANANPYGALTEHEILDKLEKSREHAAQGLYKDATEVSRDMRAKYGL